MKNAIQYYYSLFPDIIHQKQGVYLFDFNGAKYYLTPYNRPVEELNELVRISTQLLERGVYCHQFISNNYKKYVTIINQIPYVLLQYFVSNETKITIHDVLFFSKLSVQDAGNSALLRSHWKQMWMDKNDYCEYQLSQFGKQFPKIRESFSYFIGISEIGIALLDNHAATDLVISHRRIFKNDTLFELYNPLNFVLDYKERDIVEYYKDCMILDSIPLRELELMLQFLLDNDYEPKRLLARSFYPTFYFDLYENIIHNYINENSLEDIDSKVERYELFLSTFYHTLQSKLMLPDILWLKKT